MRIFVAIASFLDYEIRHTIMNCIMQADQPSSLVFGVCLQYDNRPGTDKRCLDDLIRKYNIRCVYYPYTHSKGGCWARNVAQRLYDGEEYALQVDSHTRFRKDWDSIILKDYTNLVAEGYSKPLISFLPPPYSRIDELGLDTDFHNVNELDKFNIPKPIYMTDEYWINYIGYTNQIRTNKQPHPIIVLYGGFVFGSGNWILEVEQDPLHYYTGEELALSIRSFTHGYDIMTPSEIVAWHRAHPKKELNKKHFDVFGEQIAKEKHNKAMERLRKLIEGEELGKYGLGSVRTLKEYENHTGLDFANKRVNESKV